MNDIINKYCKNIEDSSELEIIFGSNKYNRINEDPPYLCSCGKYFTSKKNLNIHSKNKDKKKRCSFSSTAINYNDFNNVISVLKKNNFKLKNDYKKHYLSINLKKRRDRIQIHGLDNIKYYCETGNLPQKDIIFQQKTYKGNFIPDVNTFNYRINWKNETNMNEADITTLISIYEKLEKSYRFIKRFTFINDELPFKFDCSIVKTSGYYYKSIKDSNVFTEFPNYEIEMELINDKFKEKVNVKSNINEMKKYMKLIFCALQNTNYPIPKLKLYNVLKSYNDLVTDKNSIINKKYSNCRNCKNNFIGPQSITLQLENLYKETNTNILENYCVTDKADGERRILFISKEENDNVYLIDSSMKVHYTGLKCPGDKYGNTIIDGEYIEKDNNIQSFWIFDLYYLNGINYTTEAFNNFTPNCRYNKLKEFISNLKKDENFKTFDNKKITKFNLNIKPFEFPNKKKDIFKCVNDLLEKSETENNYNTDGLIFTPSLLGVKVNHDGILDQSKTWVSCFKWKEPKDNTIDFLIEIIGKKDKFAYNHDTNKNNIIHLFVGSNEINYRKAVLNKDTYKVKTEYSKTLFNPNYNNEDQRAHICEIKESIGKNGIIGIYTENEEKDNEELIQDDTVVEFRYDMEKKNWIPIRVRHKKTADYKLNRGNFGNDVLVAKNNWNSIQNPVKLKYLKNKEEIPPYGEYKDEKIKEKKEIQQNIYYRKKFVDKKKKYTKGLRDFHNNIKREIINYCGLIHKGGTLFDMSCGRGGDIDKWIKAHFSYIVGFDYSKDNIEEAYERVYRKLKKKPRNFPNMIFEQADATLNYRNRISWEKYENNIGYDIINSVFNGINKKNLTCLERFKNIANTRRNQGFDVISNQFSIHYFFENLNTLTGFIQNICESCKIGGHFIGTCFDGETIFELLKDKKQGEGFIKKYKDDKKQIDETIFKIIRLYGDDKTEFLGTKESLGYKVSVFQYSIGQFHDEYLVNFNYFKQIMESYGFVLEDVKEKYSKNIFSGQAIGFFEDINLKHNLKEHEKFISYKNKYFIFKKIRIVNCENITHSLKANMEMNKEFLETKINIEGAAHEGYLLDLFSEKGVKRLKDNNFKGIPYIFKNVNYNINGKIYNILNTQKLNCKILRINNYYTANGFDKIKEEYNKLKLNNYLILELGKDAELLGINTILDDIENVMLEFNNIIYLGIIPKIIKNNYYPYLFFRKGKLIEFDEDEKNIFNPKLTINKKDKYKVSILNDCPLMGGTKTRAIVPYISRIYEKNIIYVGPTIGFAQMALAYALKILNEKTKTQPKRLKLYFNGHNLRPEHFNITKNIVHIYNYIEIHIFCREDQRLKYNNILNKISGKFGKIYYKLYSDKVHPRSLKDIEKWVENNNKLNNDTYIVPFGLRFPGFVNLLSRQIKLSLQGTELEPENGEKMRIWLVAGSGAILNSLYNVFPNAEFHILQVGSNIWEDVYNKENTTKYEYVFEKNKKYSQAEKEKFKRKLGPKFKAKRNEAFIEDLDQNEYIDMPYFSVENYDAKIWPTYLYHYKKYIKDKGKDFTDTRKNYIWNVACTKTFDEFLEQKGVSNIENSSVLNFNTNFKIYLTDATITLPNI